MASNTKYTLVDYENWQPDKLPIAANETVLVFIGNSQPKIKTELAMKIQELGNRAGYIKITGTGKDALDFHIAFYLGEIVAKDPDCELCIISNDTGYDPLIAHIKDKYKINATRKAGNTKAVKKTKAAAAATTTTKTTKKVAKVKAVKKIKVTANTTEPNKVTTKVNKAKTVKEANTTGNTDETNAAIKKVTSILDDISPKANKPKTITALKNRIRIMPGLSKLSDQEVECIIKNLEAREYLEIQAAGKIAYSHKAAQDYRAILKNQSIRMLAPDILMNGIQQTFNLFQQFGEVADYVKYKEKLGTLLKNCRSDASITDLSKIKMILFHSYSFIVNQNSTISLDPKITSVEMLEQRVIYNLMERITNNIDEAPDYHAMSELFFGEDSFAATLQKMNKKRFLETNNH